MVDDNEEGLQEGRKVKYGKQGQDH